MIDTESRSEIICSFLKQHHLQGWFSWRPEELLLQAGCVSYWGLSFLLFLGDGERVLFLPELEPQDLAPADATVITYPWGNPGCSDPFLVLDQTLHKELDRRRLTARSIGVLCNAERSSLPIMAAEQPPLPAAALQMLTREMTTNAHLDASFQSLYLRKNAAEVERIRLANQVALMGLAAWREALISGTTEAEAAAAAETAIHRQTGKSGVASARAWAMVQSGSNTAQAGCFNRSTGRKFETGEPVLIELATCVNGYWSDLTRTETVGEGGGDVTELLQAVSTAQKVAIANIRPGVAAEIIDAAARASLRQAGLGDFFTHATGHHTGFRYHDPGFAIAPGSENVLESGMVITIEPGAYVADRGMGARIEDNILVTSDGAEILSA